MALVRSSVLPEKSSGVSSCSAISGIATASRGQPAGLLVFALNHSAYAAEEATTSASLVVYDQLEYRFGNSSVFTSLYTMFTAATCQLVAEVLQTGGY